MSFDAALATRNDMGLFYFIRVSGLPYLFCCGEAPYWMRTGRRSTTGAAYTTFTDGLAYDWSETLLLEGGLAVTGGLLQPKGGMPSSGSIAFTLRVDDLGHSHNAISPTSLWLSLLQRNPVMARNTANLAQDIPAAGTPNIVMLSNPWVIGVAASPVLLYCGLETLRVGTTTQNSTTLGPILTRGAYGSIQRQHEAFSKTGTESHATGLILSDVPLVWEGRTVELYAAAGRWRLDRQGDGVKDVPEFEPYLESGKTVYESSVKLMRRFILTNVREGGDHASVVLECAEIDALIDGDILGRTPRAKAGRGPGWDYDARSGGLTSIYIGPHNWRISVSIRSDGHLGMPIQLRVLDGAVADGDTVTFPSPAGNVVMTARTSPTLLSEFLIGSLPSETAANLLGAAQLLPAWRDHYVVVGGAAAGVISFRAPFGDAGGPYAFATSKPAAFVFSQPDAATRPLALMSARLRRAIGGGNFGDVPEGFWSVSELGLFVRDTIAEFMRGAGYNVFYAGSDSWGARNPEVYFEREQSSEGKTSNKLALVFFFGGGGVTQGWAVDVFTRHDGEESFLRDLGFTEDSYFVAGTEGQGGFRVAATKSPPAFRWPARGYRRPPRIYLHDMSPWDIASFIADTGHFYDTDGATGRWLVVDGVDLVQYGTGNLPSFVSNFNNPPGADGGWYLSVNSTDTRGWAKDEETYVEIVDPQDKDQATVGVERVVFFPRPVALGEALLQFLIGGSGVEGTLDATYDVGWFGCGLAIPGSYFDIPSFLAYRDNGFERRQFCIRAGDKIRDLLDNECKAAQVQVVAEWGGVMRLIDTRPPLAGVSGVLLLDASNMVEDLANQGVGFDRAENRIVNQVSVKLRYNPVLKRHDLTAENLRADSISTYGKKEPMSITLNGSIRGLESYVVRVSDRIFAAYAKPYAVIEVYVSRPVGWSIRRGDVVTVTSNVIPNPDTYGRGVVSLPCKVFGKDDYYTGGGNDGGSYFTKLTLVCRAYSGDRFGVWAPAAYMVSRSGAICTCEQKLYSNPQDAAVRDVSLFAQGMNVEVYNFATGAVEQRTVSAVNASANTITLNAAPTPTAGLITFREYSAQTLAQRQTASMGSGAKFITGTDKPYSYQ
jgi:hypothetical protein